MFRCVNARKARGSCVGLRAESVSEQSAEEMKEQGGEQKPSSTQAKNVGESGKNVH